METMQSLGRRIRDRRAAEGYSIKSAAKESGIARDTWRKIERGGSVQDTKRHIAMQFLGMLDDDEAHADVVGIEHYAANTSETVDLNVMFVQAVRFPATVGTLFPGLHDHAERATAELSALYSAAIRSAKDDDIERSEAHDRAAANQMAEPGPPEQPGTDDLDDEDVEDISVTVDDEEPDESTPKGSAPEAGRKPPGADAD